jgi:hypothetical protein
MVGEVSLEGMIPFHDKCYIEISRLKAAGK